jgi:hypothetical protein
MVKFKLKGKGVVTQGFNNANAMYADRGGVHTGIDTFLGWNKPITADNNCFVYKIITKDQSAEGWQGVYMLVPQGGDFFVEIVAGHFNDIRVSEGQSILEHQLIGLEGNKGFVFSSGVRITREMQENGDRRGTHTHTGYRPVKRVRRVRSGQHYLNIRGARYRDAEGYFYEILHPNNGTNGMVNPMDYHRENTMLEDLAVLARLLPTLLRK